MGDYGDRPSSYPFSVLRKKKSVEDEAVPFYLDNYKMIFENSKLLLEKKKHERDVLNDLYEVCEESEEIQADIQQDMTISGFSQPLNSPFDPPSRPSLNLRKSMMSKNPPKLEKRNSMPTTSKISAASLLAKCPIPPNDPKETPSEITTESLLELCPSPPKELPLLKKENKGAKGAKGTKGTK